MPAAYPFLEMIAFLSFLFLLDYCVCNTCYPLAFFRIALVHYPSYVLGRPGCSLVLNVYVLIRFTMLHCLCPCVCSFLVFITSLTLSCSIIVGVTVSACTRFNKPCYCLQKCAACMFGFRTIRRRGVSSPTIVSSVTALFKKRQNDASRTVRVIFLV